MIASKPLPVVFIRPKFDPMNVLFYAFVGIMLGFSLGCALMGCAEAMSADDRYRAQILWCVERSTTRLESKACRDNVDFQFKVHDGGVQR